MSVVLDSSALVAVIEDEPEAGAMLQAMAGASPLYVSTFTVLEARIVMLRRHGPAAMVKVDRLIDSLGVGILPFDAEHLRLATAAYARFGKGIDPRARLNLGDCVSYALARSLDAPLLFKGADFTATDVTPALPAGA
ncbi:MAG: type II toxin-antitoxin system VapC family toxin [Acetobacteraceae bacterium]|nr:type II toxin-antitoxin system VapC family toxin [Acetobacteraceae bacterium]